jgi:5'-nucleotidase
VIVKINILAAALLTMLTASTQAAEKPLRILLVNDDGCQSVGTTSLQEKLAAKGYDVWMVALRPTRAASAQR